MLWPLLAFASAHAQVDTSKRADEEAAVKGSAAPVTLDDPVLEAFVKRALPPLPPDAPQPARDPRNFAGTWFQNGLLEKFAVRTMYRKPTPLSAEGRKILLRRIESARNGKPISNASAKCLPPAHPFQLDLNFPFTILHASDAILFVFEEFHGVWKIRMNQPHRRSGPREYMGDSVGRWDGDTLVVDTTNFKEAFWIDPSGVPASRDARLEHRIRKIEENGPALEIITTVHDAAMYTGPWSMVRTFAWRPDRAIFAEYNCEQQVGGPDGVGAFGLVEE